MRRIASRSMTLAVAVALAALALTGQAGNGSAVREVGRYAVHYNAMPASELDAAVAERHELPREADRCVVTVAVMERDSGEPVEAGVMGSATRPDGRMHPLEMRAIRDAGGVYYVGVVPLESPGELTFELEVQPGTGTPPQTIRFTREFAPARDGED